MHGCAPDGVAQLGHGLVPRRPSPGRETPKNVVKEREAMSDVFAFQRRFGRSASRSRGPGIVMSGITTCRREPSGSVASTNGLDRSKAQSERRLGNRSRMGGQGGALTAAARRRRAHSSTSRHWCRRWCRGRPPQGTGWSRLAGAGAGHGGRTGNVHRFTGDRLRPVLPGVRLALGGDRSPPLLHRDGQRSCGP